MPPPEKPATITGPPARPRRPGVGDHATQEGDVVAIGGMRLSVPCPAAVARAARRALRRDHRPAARVQRRDDAGLRDLRVSPAAPAVQEHEETLRRAHGGGHVIDAAGRLARGRRGVARGGPAGEEQRRRRKHEPHLPPSPLIAAG
jgi:hypothetical protein